MILTTLHNIYFILIEIHQKKILLRSMWKNHNYNLRVDLLTIPGYKLTQSITYYLNYNLYNEFSESVKTFSIHLLKKLLERTY